MTKEPTEYELNMEAARLEYAARRKLEYSFEINWPAPFRDGWQLSGQRFATPHEAGKAMADFLVIALENGTVIEGRLARVQPEVA